MVVVPVVSALVNLVLLDVVHLNVVCVVVGPCGLSLYGCSICNCYPMAATLWLLSP